MPGARMNYAIVQKEEAEAIKAGATAEWFEHLMNGFMLVMPQRPTLSKPMQARMDVQNFRMRSKSAEERGFYIWLEAKGLPPETFPTDETVDTSLAAEPADFDPLNDVG